MRLILLLHRYVGMVVGLVMALWCLSGFVMMYQGYPRLTEPDRLQGLTPIQAGTIHVPALDPARPVRGFTVEMLSGRPVLRIQGRPDALYDLRNGEPIREVTAGMAVDVAGDFAAGHALSGRPHLVGKAQVDQWTLEGAGHRGPLYHVRFDDGAGTELYINSDNAQAVQITTRRTRLLGWLGAVPHWLYPTILRRHGEVWDQVVVWTSLVGVFLTLTGLYVGIARFRPHPGGRWSPYRRWHYWHHLTGLAFGLLTLTWVASGLFTMTPWGFLDTPVGLQERMQLAGTLTGAQVTHFLDHMPAPAGRAVQQLRAEPLGGTLYVLAVSRDGTRTRLNAEGQPAPLSEPELGQALGVLGTPVSNLTLLSKPDDFYYDGYQRVVKFPVYKVELRDAGHTTLYLDTVTGRLLDAADTTARQSRWLRTGLHDWDFTATLRERPLWDIVVWLLLCGVTVGTLTGVWIAFKRVRADVHRLRRHWARRRATLRARVRPPEPGLQ